MIRIRQAHMQLAPDLDQYFATSHHDDEAGVLQTYSFRRQLGLMHLLSGSPVIVTGERLTGAVALIGQNSDLVHQVSMLRPARQGDMAPDILVGSTR
jgi:hypothetical protein